MWNLCWNKKQTNRLVAHVPSLVAHTLNDDGVDEYVDKNVLDDKFSRDLKRFWKERCSWHCEIYNKTCVNTDVQWTLFMALWNQKWQNGKMKCIYETWSCQEKNDVGDTARSGKESLRKCETVRDRRHGPDVSPALTFLVNIIFVVVSFFSFLPFFILCHLLLLLLS